MNDLPTYEEAIKRLNRCQFCGCDGYSPYCKCLIGCHEMQALAVVEEQTKKELSLSPKGKGKGEE